MAHKIFEVENVIITLKALGVNIVTSLLWIPFAAILLLTKGTGTVVFGLLYFVLALFVWGYLANLFWDWD